MTNPINQHIQSHVSKRKYKDRPIEDAKLEEILKSASRASTSGNMQTYSIIITKDAERKKQLYKFHYEQRMILEAPVLLTFCADWNRMIKWCRMSGADPYYDNFLSFMVSVGDAFIAAQNAALAAEALELGVCYMGTTHYCTPELIEFFNLPEMVYPITTLVVGYPNEDPEKRMRLPMNAIIHSESYFDYNEEEIRSHYKEKEDYLWDRYGEIEGALDNLKKKGIKSMAQVYTDLKYTKKNNEEFSAHLIESLFKQGFGKLK